MANWDFGPNRVLNAYVEGVGMRREEEQRQFQNKLKEAENKRAEEQLKTYQAHLKAQEEAERARLGMQEAQLSLERQSKELEARHMIGQMINSGAATVRQPTQGESLSSPVMGNLGGFDPRTIVFAKPEEIFARKLSEARQIIPVKAAEAGAITTATKTAEAPFEQLQSSMKFQQARDLQELRGKQELEQIDKTVEGQKAVARIHGQYGLDAARIRTTMGDLSPEAWTGTVYSYATGENARPLGNTAKDLLIKQHLRQAGFQEFSGVQAQKLRDMHMLDPVTQTMNEFMAKLPTTKINAAGDLVISKVPAGDLNNLAKMISARAGHVAQTIGGESSRLSEDDIKRALGAMIVPGITVNQAKERMNLFMADLNNRVSNIILGGYSPKQKLLILRRYDFDPARFNQVVQHNGKKDYLFKQAADGEWGYFDKKSGRYKDMSEE